MRTYRVYIATALERHADHNALRDALAATGRVKISYDWTHHGSVKETGVERIQEVARAEMRGVLEADATVALLPGGRGTHAEIGLALSTGRPLVLVSRTPEGHFGCTAETCAFYHGPNTTHLADDLPMATKVQAILRALDDVEFQPSPSLQTLRAAVLSFEEENERYDLGDAEQNALLLDVLREARKALSAPQAFQGVGEWPAKGFNLNETVWFRLNDQGREHLIGFYEQWPQAYPDPAATVAGMPDDEGWCRLQLWDFMERFSPIFEWGGTFPVEGGEIFFSKPAAPHVEETP